MQNEIHPITRHIVDALSTEAQMLGDIEMRNCANLIVGSGDGDVIGRELIALAQEMVAIRWIEAAEQMIVLGGLALGDAAASTIAGLSGSTKAKVDIGVEQARLQPNSPRTGVAGGPLARFNATKAVEDPAAAGCPFHRFLGLDGKNGKNKKQ